MIALHSVLLFLALAASMLLYFRFPRAVGGLALVVFALLGIREIACGLFCNALSAAFCGIVWGVPPFLLGPWEQPTCGTTTKAGRQP